MSVLAAEADISTNWGEVVIPRIAERLDHITQKRQVVLFFPLRKTNRETIAAWSPRRGELTLPMDAFLATKPCKLGNLGKFKIQADTIETVIEDYQRSAGMDDAIFVVAIKDNKFMQGQRWA